MEKRITPGKHLKKEDEPELLKAVNYALKEYPCMLRCLEDGSRPLCLHGFDFAHQF